ncbi:MAG TPA: hypothetical protein VGD01_17675 [Candidatus Elarobacter sp.]|jgi:hypothetical protein
MYVIGFLIAGSLTAEGATPMPDEVTAHANTSSRALQAFAHSRSFADLRLAVDEMEAAVNLHALKPETFVAQRRTLVRGWAQVLKAIEQSYDPAYDPNDRNNWPIRGLPDPQTIPDPTERARVAAALAANSEKIRRASYYHDLSVIDLRAQTLLKTSLDLFRKVEPDGTPADFAALDGILQQAGLSSTRRTKIDAMFYARSAP